MPPRAERGLCRAADRRFVRWAAHLAVAQEPTPDQQSAIRSNCRSDFMANCSGVPRGGKEAMQCLKDNVAKLSSGCQQAVKAVMPAPAAKPPAPPVTAAPAAPAAPRSATSPRRRAAAPSLLPAGSASGCCSCSRRGETGGSSRIDAARCAGAAGSSQTGAGSEKRREPSSKRTTARRGPACRDRGRAGPDLCPGAHQCRAEYRAYCSDVDIGGGRVVACLQANAASLSPTCQSGLAELGR